MSYEFLEHTADVKFKADGASWDEMFRNAAGALNETIRGDIKILELEEKSFEVEGRDLEILLHNFLEEFVFLLDANDFLVSKIKFIRVEIIDGGGKISCSVVGDKAQNYKFTNDVKAITFNEMVVREEEGIYSCNVVLDV
jgi:SHS2 domain-containing protein